MFKKFLVVFSFVLFYFLLNPAVITAQDPEITPVQDFQQAQIIKIIEEGEKLVFDTNRPYQLVEAKILSGENTGEIVKIEHGSRISLGKDQKVKAGDKVILYRGGFNDQVDDYQIIDKYRLDKVLYFVIFFFVLVLGVSRIKGLGSLIGLAISLFIILKYIVPEILAGKDPVLISIIGSSIIMFSTIYLSHGFSKKTTIALLSTIITLVITGLLATFSIALTRLTGLGDEVAYSLTFGTQTEGLNFKGLLLGGMIIGALGILDDVTTTQSSSIQELSRANKEYHFLHLLKSGFNIGKDHISSVVNTLFLAYTGASLPLLILLVLNPSEQPLWFLLNNEPIAEEIVRTLVGSIGLVLAVPITTLIAAYAFSKK